jgi:YVTN family beta-propeller protein
LDSYPIARILGARIVLVLALCGAQAAAAQVPVGTVPVGNGPWGIAIDPVRNRIHVANYFGNSVTTIDGATHAKATKAAGLIPTAVAVNPVTGKVYVANIGGGSVTVIDGAATGTVAVGTSPASLAINAVTNRVYVANFGGASVTVIDGATDAVIDTVAVGSAPLGVAVNPVTNRIYVPSTSLGTVKVIDGLTHASSTILVGSEPRALAVDPVRNRIYVANRGSDSITVIDGATAATTTVAVGDSPTNIAVDPATGKVYVANLGSGNVAVVDGATLATTFVAVGSDPRGLAVDAVAGRIYVTSETGHSITVIDAGTQATTTVPAGSSPQQVAVNPVTHRAYAANFDGDSVTVIDGAANSTQAVATGTYPVAIALDPARNRMYVANRDSGTVTVLSLIGGPPVTVTVGAGPRGIAVDPIHNVIYTANQDAGSITVIDGFGFGTSSVPVGGTPRAVAVDPNTHKVHVAAGTRAVRFNASLAEELAVEAPGASFVSVAVDGVTGKAYFANQASNYVLVFDGHATLSVPVGTGPEALAVDAGLNRIYCARPAANSVTVIDGATLATTSFAVQNSPRDIAVHPTTHRVFVANHLNSSVTIFDPVTLGTAAIGTDGNPLALAVDPIANRIYVASDSGNATVIDGASLAGHAVATGAARAVAVNPATGKAYFAGTGLTVVTPTTTASYKHESFITMQGGFFTSRASPVLTFGWDEPYEPVDPAVRTVYYRLDDGHGTFTGSGPGPYTATLPDLARGQHYVIAFVADAMEGTFNGNDAGALSPIVGTPVIRPIFAVTPPVIAAASPLPPTHMNFTYSQSLEVSGGTGANTYAVTAGTLPPGLAIGPGGILSGTPTAAGNYGFTVTVTDSSGGSGSKAFFLEIVAGPAIVASPSPAPFGSVAVGYPSAPLTIVASNMGNANLVVGTLAVSGPYASEFVIASETCGTVAPTRGCSIRIVFTPTSTGFRTVNLLIPSNDALRPTLGVTLSGTGTSIVDTTPAPFAFTDVTGVPIVSEQTSAPVTITGISAPAPISVAGGSYSIGCIEPYGTAPSTVLNTQTVCVRHTASSAYATAVNTVLTVGGVSDTFTSTTMPQHLLTVTLQGTGSGTVTGPGIDCPGDCTQLYAAGGVASLAAAPAASSTFTGWGGACSGTGACEVTMDAARAVSASFTLKTYTVAPSAGPGGSISPATPQTVTHGATTSFTVTPNAGYEIASVAGCGGALAGNSYTTAVITAPCTVTATFAAVDPPRLMNISTRMQVLTGNDVMIGGFVIGGSETKQVAIVATGPSLVPFGINNPLPDPSIVLVRSSDQAIVAANDNWESAANHADLTAAGFAPSNALEAAILIELAPGAYTAIVEGVGGGTGVSVIGVYEVDGPTIPLINISTRGRVMTGNDVMIGGFVITGSGSQTVAIVATGPSLAPFGITSPLANPKITLVRSSDQVVIDSNDDWQSHANASQLSAAGFAPSNPLESGIHTTLPPGAYTVIVEGVGGGTGVSVIGVYAVQ